MFYFHLVTCWESEILAGTLAPYFLSRYDLFLPLHRLWLGYMSELLALAKPPTPEAQPSATAMPKAEPMHAKLLKADYQGAIISGAY